MTIQEVLNQRGIIDAALAPFDIKCRIRCSVFSDTNYVYNFFPNTIMDFKWVDSENNLCHQPYNADELYQKIQQVDIKNWSDPQDPNHLSTTEGTGIIRLSTGQVVTVKMILSFYNI